MTEDPSQILWLSLGENCLPDDILKRHDRKSFSTPYSSGRTNIDYAIALEKSDYSGLLQPENLGYGDAWGAKVVRSSCVTTADDIFDVSCSKGFEFTHHNPIESVKDRASLERKVSRLLEIRGKRNVLFLYHHRHNGKTRIEKLREKLKDFSALYSSKNARCTIGLFRQQIISEKSQRRVEKIVLDDTLIEFIFHSEFVWGGKDPDILWARNDDDLIKKMVAELDDFTTCL